MAEGISELLIVIVAIGLVLLLFYVYLGTVSKAFRAIGFTSGEASTIILLTLFFSSIWIPIFPYHGWIVAISIGGAVIPIIICASVLKSRRVGLAEASLGTMVVAFVTYFVTRAEEGVGIVADIPLAFAPALAAGLFSFSTFWADKNKAAPVAYFSGVIGTLIGADVFHLGEILSFTPPSEGSTVLVVGGAGVFDMVYLTGIIAVLVDLIIFWVRKQQARYGFGAVASEFKRSGEDLPYARTVEPAPTIRPEKKQKRI